MKTKFFISFILSAILIVLCSIPSFANNMIEDAENTVSNDAKDVAQDVTNVTQDASHKFENGIKDTGEAISGTINTARNDVMSMTTDNSNYSATRTATSTNNATFAGMSANAWAWLIVGIFGVAIIALVWIYGNQKDIHTQE